MFMFIFCDRGLVYHDVICSLAKVFSFLNLVLEKAQIVISLNRNFCDDIFILYIIFT